MSVQNVFTLYKEQGETPLEALERLRKEKSISEDVPLTYAGRLDPMAEGLLLVLAGEECKKKDQYLGLDKEYAGEILFGFSTDTGDVLGLPAENDQISNPKSQKEGTHSRILKNVRMCAKEFVGKQMQKYPAYSSKTVEGKSLWQWAREGKEVERPTQEIEVYSFEITDCRTEQHSNILSNVRMLVNKVKGDFRQEEILEKWAEVLGGEEENKALICKFKTHVSSGTYVRVLAEELGEKLGTKAILYSLKRTKIGEYSLLDK